jgi:hypothetical protein
LRTCLLGAVLKDAVMFTLNTIIRHAGIAVFHQLFHQETHHSSRRKTLDAIARAFLSINLMERRVAPRREMSRGCDAAVRDSPLR